MGMLNVKWTAFVYSFLFWFPTQGTFTLEAFYLFTYALTLITNWGNMGFNVLPKITLACLKAGLLCKRISTAMLFLATICLSIANI